MENCHLSKFRLISMTAPTSKHTYKHTQKHTETHTHSRVLLFSILRTQLLSGGFPGVCPGVLRQGNLPATDFKQVGVACASPRSPMKKNGPLHRVTPHYAPRPPPPPPPPPEMLLQHAGTSGKCSTCSRATGALIGPPVSSRRGTPLFWCWGGYIDNQSVTAGFTFQNSPAVHRQRLFTV